MLTGTSGRVTKPYRLGVLEAVFIALMALVVLLTGWVTLVVVYKLFKTDG